MGYWAGGRARRARGMSNGHAAPVAAHPPHRPSPPPPSRTTTSGGSTPCAWHAELAAALPLPSSACAMLPAPTRPVLPHADVCIARCEPEPRDGAEHTPELSTGDFGASVERLAAGADVVVVLLDAGAPAPGPAASRAVEAATYGIRPRQGGYGPRVRFLLAGVDALEGGEAGRHAALVTAASSLTALLPPGAPLSLQTACVPGRLLATDPPNALPAVAADVGAALSAVLARALDELDADCAALLTAADAADRREMRTAWLNRARRVAATPLAAGAVVARAVLAALALQLCLASAAVQAWMQVLVGGLESWGVGLGWRRVCSGGRATLVPCDPPARSFPGPACRHRWRGPPPSWVAPYRRPRRRRPPCRWS